MFNTQILKLLIDWIHLLVFSAAGVEWSAVRWSTKTEHLTEKLTNRSWKSATVENSWKFRKNAWALPKQTPISTLFLFNLFSPRQTTGCCSLFTHRYVTDAGVKPWALWAVLESKNTLSRRPLGPLADLWKPEQMSWLTVRHFKLHFDVWFNHSVHIFQ